MSGPDYSPRVRGGTFEQCAAVRVQKGLVRPHAESVLRAGVRAQRGLVADQPQVPERIDEASLPVNTPRIW